MAKREQYKSAVEKKQTTVTISLETDRRVERLAALITKRNSRMTRCSKHEAVRQAVDQMLTQLKEAR